MSHELSILGVYFSPFILVFCAGMAATLLTARVLNRLGWSRFFANPPWVFVAFLTIYICIFSMLEARL